MKRSIILVTVLFIIFSFTACKKTEANVPAGDVCYVTVDCHTAVANAALSAEKREVLPKDGMVLDHAAVSVKEGMNALEAFEAAMKENKLQYELQVSSFTGTTYVEGACNLYSLDCGDLSGWLFSFDGEFPPVGMADTPVKKDSQILLIYSCDMGPDVGYTWE